MPFLGSKCAKTAFAAGALPGPRSGSLQRSPDPLTWLRGPTSKGRGGAGRGEGKEKEKGWERKGWEGKGRGREGKLRPLSQIPGSAPVDSPPPERRYPIPIRGGGTNFRAWGKFAIFDWNRRFQAKSRRGPSKPSYYPDLKNLHSIGRS